MMVTLPLNYRSIGVQQLPKDKYYDNAAAQMSIGVQQLPKDTTAKNIFDLLFELEKWKYDTRVPVAVRGYLDFHRKNTQRKFVQSALYHSPLQYTPRSKNGY